MHSINFGVDGELILCLAKIPICRRIKYIYGSSNLACLRVKLVRCCACLGSWSLSLPDSLALAAICCWKTWLFGNSCPSWDGDIRSHDSRLPTDCSGLCCCGSGLALCPQR